MNARPGPSTRVVRHREHGEPEVLTVEQDICSLPGPGQVLLRSLLIGVNLNAAMRRRGIGPLPSPLPGAPAGDVVGRVEAIGAGVDHLAIGDRVAAIVAQNAYADYVLADAHWLVAIPDEVSDTDASVLAAPAQVALAALRAGRFAAGETVFIPGAAGVIGHLAAQIARALGAARVVGSAGGASKIAYAQQNGCDACVDHLSPGWPDRVRAALPAAGPDVVVDGIGGKTTDAALDLLAPLGRLVFFGTTGGAPNAIDVQRLTGLTYVVGSSFGSWRRHRPDEVRAGLALLVDLAARGDLSVGACEVHPLDDVVTAHRRIEVRERIGRVLMRP